MVRSSVLHVAEMGEELHTWVFVGLSKVCYNNGEKGEILPTMKQDPHLSQPKAIYSSIGIIITPAAVTVISLVLINTSWTLQAPVKKKDVVLKACDVNYTID